MEMYSSLLRGCLEVVFFLHIAVCFCGVLGGSYSVDVWLGLGL